MIFFNNKIKNIQKKLMEQRDTIESFIDQLSKRDRNRLEWCTVHQKECKSVGLLMWEKDLNCRYTFLNSRHCNDFYQVSLAHVRDLISKTDEELIQDFYERTGLKHTFGEMCFKTDQYVLTEQKVCRFWEIGYIGENVFILDVTKKPLMKDNKMIGIQAWALNQTNKECEIKALLDVFLKTGQAVKVNTESEDIAAAYLITKNSNPFNGVFPT